MFTDTLDQLENTAVDLVAKVAPWAAPLPTAYLVGRATVAHLAWPATIGVVAAIIIECLGLATTATALRLWDYNQGKRKSDPSAPVPLAVGLVAVYFVVATGLTVLLDIAPHLAAYAPAIFPTLSLTGVTVLAIRADHQRRLDDIESVKAERKEKRQSRRKERRQRGNTETSSGASNNANLNGKMDALQAARLSKKDARLDALLTFYASNPDAGPTEAGEAVGVSRQTIYTYNSELEQAGRIRRNGSGVEVLEQ
jgi:hypothetical protein